WALLAGAGFLLPNSFIVAADYFQAQYPGSTIVFDLSLTYILVAFCSVLLNNVLVETLLTGPGVVAGYVLSFVTLLFVAVFEIWWQVFSNTTSYGVNLLAVSVVAVGCTAQQSSFYGYTGMLPNRYTQAVMTGESAAGVLVSTSRILTRLLLDDVRLNTLVFFCCSLLLLVAVCCVLHQLLRRTAFVRHHVAACSADPLSETQAGDQVTLVDIVEEADGKDYGRLTLASNSDDSAFQSTETLPAGGAASYDTFSERAGGTSYRVSELLVHVRRSGRARPPALDCCAALKRGTQARSATVRRVWPYMVSICLAYLVTLSLFPGIESEVHSCTLGSWMPVVLMAIFNVSDFAGKVLASLPYEWSRRQLVAFSTLRFLLIPPLVLCAAPRAEPLLAWEGWPMLFSLLLLGLTNGLVGSLPMILAPDKVPDQNRELCDGNRAVTSYQG
ncbi:LOW QUALITY PROTEIN: equilibrative nucleoside transporter 4-like, partial [Pollicipes pollicipes]|uniref:LOW QUALITY PROTEIN: equilibrative nucleoside transporter 4-like n=1 Tax=Pollicipes pollicipes TaxID=41117 RepID=UPI0018857A39